MLPLDATPLEYVPHHRRVYAYTRVRSLVRLQSRKVLVGLAILLWTLLPLESAFAALPATASFPLSGNIVSRWKLDEASGSRADSVGSNTLTDNNTVTSAAGQFSVDAADFELGNTEYLSKTDTASLSITGDLTFAAWVQLESYPGYRVLMSKFDPDTPIRSYAFRIDGDSNRMEFLTSSDGTATDGYSLMSYSFSAGTWYHMAIVYDASEGEAAYYINGAQVGATQTGYPTSIFDGAQDFQLGKESTRYWDGLMQDAILWNAELTSANVTSLYDSYFATPYLPQIIWYGWFQNFLSYFS